MPMILYIVCTMPSFAKGSPGDFYPYSLLHERDYTSVHTSEMVITSSCHVICISFHRIRVDRIGAET